MYVARIVCGSFIYRAYVGFIYETFLSLESPVVKLHICLIKLNMPGMNYAGVLLMLRVNIIAGAVIIVAFDPDSHI